jgi:hypothetical protein
MIYRAITGLALLAAAAVFSGPARADHFVRCESHDFDRNSCAVDTRGGVSIANQLSDTPCIEGRNWGYGGGRVWVDDGCAAEFRVGERYSYSDRPFRRGMYASVGGVVQCESVDMQRSVCEIPRNSSVRLINQLSDSPCVRGSTWGANRNRIWVDDGCRAEFQVIR